MTKKAIFFIVVVVLAFVIGAVYALIGVQQSILRDPSNISSIIGDSTSSNALNDPEALIREVRAYMQQQGWNTTQADPEAANYEPWYDTNMTRVAEGIVKSKYSENSAMIVITALTGDCWSGSIMGSDNIQTTWDGCGAGYHAVPCSGLFGSYSLAMQRTGEGYAADFLVQVWKGGELLKQALTKADYGLVSFAGDC